jgi:putative ATP-dependent endonuclease of the OLD family
LIVEQVCISNFRSIGETQTLRLADSVTTFVGGNGAGKTAAMAALAKLFGVSKAQRTVVKSDFHVAAEAAELQSGAVLFIDAVFAFPELAEGAGDTGAVAEFWRQMAASAPQTPLKARMRLQATWTDDGTPEGSVEEELRWISHLDDAFDWEECAKVAPADRGAVQMIYIPAVRNAGEQVRALLRGRLWRAARWSGGLSGKVGEHAQALQSDFATEAPLAFIQERLAKRWRQVHTGDTDSDPVVKLIEHRFETLVRNAEVRFRPAPDGAERELERLSDGQRSLFQIALTAATLEVEQDAAALKAEEAPFDHAKLRRVQLTLLAVEEPENNLSPFFLSRIMSLASDIGAMSTAQVLIASHSASILSRVEPKDTRYFRLAKDRQTQIRDIPLPADDSEARAFIRLAVRAYPEIYFARFVVLAEGDSEQVVIPRVAEAWDVPLDQSFVPVVPLGGRFADRMWRLLTELEIPHATLLDLDLGRQHGGAAAIKSTVKRLAAAGTDVTEDILSHKDGLTEQALDALTDEDFFDLSDATKPGPKWIAALRREGVFFCYPLDLDFSMLRAFPSAYKVVRPGGSGPGDTPEAIAALKATTLKTGGTPATYDPATDDLFRWYPYLFLQKSKPEAHLLALSRIDTLDLASDAPDEITELIWYIAGRLEPKGA